MAKSRSKPAPQPAPDAPKGPNIIQPQESKQQNSILSAMGSPLQGSPGLLGPPWDVGFNLGGAFAGGVGDTGFGCGAAPGGFFYNGWGSIGLNAYGVPYGSWANYWLMDRNPTVALASAAADAPIWGAEITYESKPGVPQEIIDFVRDQLRPHERHLLKEGTRCRNDGFHAEEIMFDFADVTTMTPDGVTSSQRMFTLKKLQPLACELTTALRDDLGDVVGVRNQGAEIDDVRRFLWLTYDGRGIYPYGRSRKENFKNPWRIQEYIYSVMEYATNITVRPFGYVTYPYGMKDQNGNLIDLKGNADKIGKGMAAGQFALIPDPFAPYAEQMIEKGIDPSKCMPYKIGWYDTKTDHGAGFERLMGLTDKGIVSGILMPPRAILEAEHGSKADAGEHSDTGVKINEDTLGMICRHVSVGIIDTLLVQNFGPKYRGCVWWKPAPLVDMQATFNNDLVKQTLAGPIGPFLLKRVVDIANIMETAGVKCREFDQDELAEDMDREAQEQRQVQIETAKAKGGAGKPGDGEPRKASMGDDDGGHWVTMDGEHVFIERGEIMKGPQNLVGKKASHLGENPRRITPLHLVNDTKKVNNISQDMKANGYHGRPILVAEGDHGKLHALTGTHRLAAAKRAHISVPTFRISQKEMEDGNLDLDFLRSTDDDDKESNLRRAGLTHAADLMQQEIDDDKKNGHFAPGAIHASLSTTDATLDYIVDSHNRLTPEERKRRKQFLLALLAFFGWQAESLIANPAALATDEPYTARLAKTLREHMSYAAIAQLQPEGWGKYLDAVNADVKTVADDMAAKLNDTTAKNIATGMTNGATRDDAIESILKKSVESRAETIEDDMTHVAAQVGAMATAQVDQREMVWICADDERVCGQCGPLDGVVAPVGGEFSPGVRYPVIDTHSNCRCRISEVPK